MILHNENNIKNGIHVAQKEERNKTEINVQVR